MRMNSVSPLLIVIAIILAAGFYLLVDSYSRLTVAIAQNTEALKQIGSQLSKTPRGFSSPSSTDAKQNENSANGISANANVADDLANFANAEFYPPDGVHGGQRISAISAVPGNFNSLVRSEQIASAVWNICNDSLAENNLENVMEWQPKLAESWEVSADGLVYTIKIRRGATWHPYVDPVTKQKIPAREVSASDFVFFWECLQNADIPCDSLRNYYELLETIEAVDPHTLRVAWKEPYSLSKVFTLGLSPLPRHYFRPDAKMTDKEFADYLKTTPRNLSVVGCGAYRFAEYKPNESITFEIYDDYYGIKPFAEKMVWRVIGESSIQLLEFQKDKLTDLGLLPEQWMKETAPPRYRVITPDIENAAKDAAEWERRKAVGDTPNDYQWEKFQYEPPATSWSYIGWNMKNPIFADKKVRQALAMLTDRERILREVYFGFGRLCDGPFIKNSPYADAQMSAIPFDPIGAKKLLDEAGWRDTDGDGILDRVIDGKSRQFTFTLIYNSTNPLRRQIATILQAELKKAGIDMQINSLDWSVMLQKVEDKSFDACVLGWTGVLESDPYQVWHSSQADLKGSSNHVDFRNARADELIANGRRELDGEKRAAIYREFYRLVADEQPYTFLISNVALTAQKKTIRNALIYKLGMSDTYQWQP